MFTLLTFIFICFLRTFELLQLNMGRYLKVYSKNSEIMITIFHLYNIRIQKLLYIMKNKHLSQILAWQNKHLLENLVIMGTKPHGIRSLLKKSRYTSISQEKYYVFILSSVYYVSRKRKCPSFQNMKGWAKLSVRQFFNLNFSTS